MNSKYVRMYHRQLSCNALAIALRGALFALVLIGIPGSLTQLSATEAPPVPAPKPAPKPTPIPTDMDENAGNEAKKKEADLPPGFDWDAQHVSFDEKNNAYVLSGNAFVRAPGPPKLLNHSIKLEADNIIFYRETKELYAEGHVRMRIGESEMAAEVVYLHLITENNVDDVSGYLLDANVRVSAPPDALSGITHASREERKEKERDEARQFSPDKLGVTEISEKDPHGIYIDAHKDPQARTNLMFRANRVVIHNRMFMTADDAFITTDDMVHPQYGAAAGKLDFYIKEVPDPAHPGKTILKPAKVVAHRGRINIMGVNTFPLPTMTYDLIKKSTFFKQSYGNSNRWGPYALTRVGFAFSGNESRLFDPTHIYFDMEERYKRGPAGGGEFDWQTGARPTTQRDGNDSFGRGLGHLNVWAIDEVSITGANDILRARENFERRIQPKIDGTPRRKFDPNLLFDARRRLESAGPPSFNIETHRGDLRGFVDFAQHQPLKRFAGIDGIELDLKYKRESDRDVLLEYFPDKYYTPENQPEALTSLRKPGDNYSIELLYRGNPQDFDGAPARSPTEYGTFTNYEPALTYSLVPTPLYQGFVLTGEFQAARLRRDFDRAIYNQNSFTADRAYTKIDIARPYKLGILNLVPHIGTQQQEYDNSRLGGDIHQGAVTYGLDATTRFYGTFSDFENDALGLNGLRHIIEPRFSYSGVGDTSTRATNLLDFDAIDNLTPVDKITFALDQTFQTRHQSHDGEESHASNFAGFDMAVDLYPRTQDRNRLLNGDQLDLFRLDGFLRALDVVRLDSGLGFSIEDGKLETAVYGIQIDPQTRWKLKFEERYNFNKASQRILGSDQLRVRFEYALSERWDFAVERVQQLRKSALNPNGRQRQNFMLTRHYGALDANFTYSVDPATGGATYMSTVSPAVVYRNVVVPTQDLLVDSAEVSGEADAPEENNFNPFSLLKTKRQSKSKAKKGDVLPPPPPPSSRDDSVPTPPPPESDQHSSLKNGGHADDTVGSFEAPGAPAPKASATHSNKVDADEWTAPAPAPAPVPASTR